LVVSCSPPTAPVEARSKPAPVSARPVPGIPPVAIPVQVDVWSLHLSAADVLHMSAEIAAEAGDEARARVLATRAEKAQGSPAQVWLKLGELAAAGRAVQGASGTTAYVPAYLQAVAARGDAVALHRAVSGLFSAFDHGYLGDVFDTFIDRRGCVASLPRMLTQRRLSMYAAWAVVAERCPALRARAEKELRKGAPFGWTSIGHLGARYPLIEGLCAAGHCAEAIAMLPHSSQRAR